MRHTVIIPSYNTLEHLKNTYESILRYGGDNVDVIIIDDASEDGTKEWLDSLNGATNVKVIISPVRKGHTFWYDEGMRLSETEIASILHSDMIIGPGYFDNMLKHLEKGKVVCATRIEPPIHPAGKEKIVRNFGDDANNFNWNVFEEFVETEREERKDVTTRGIFAPWMVYKSDHLSIGGHDQMFAPFGYEDSDIFNRWILTGYEMVQSRDALCYHMTCRGHRWNKGVGIENSDYQKIMGRCRREYLRKWGSWIENDEYQYPVIPPKYDIGIIINGGMPILEALEPWCSTIYIKDDYDLIVPVYITKEQPNTLYDLRERIKPFDNEKNNEILVEVTQSTFTQQDYQIIQQLSQIIQQQGEPGRFQLGNIVMEIIQMNEYQNDLINI